MFVVLFDGEEEILFDESEGFGAELGTRACGSTGMVEGLTFGPDDAELELDDAEVCVGRTLGAGLSGTKEDVVVGC